MNTARTPGDEHARFTADGFVALRGFVSGGELRELVTHVERFVRDVVPRLPSSEVFYEDGDEPATLKQIQRMGEHDPWFNALLGAGRLPALAARLLGGPVVPRNLQYFDKPAGASLPTPPHQDGHYFMLEPCAAVTMWLALDDVDEESGCVRYVRGSHAGGPRAHARTATLGFSQGIVDYPRDVDRECEVPLPARAGDLLAHHALTIHRADANRTRARARRALGFVYYDARAREDVAAHEAYRRALLADLDAQGRLRAPGAQGNVATTGVSSPPVTRVEP